MKVALGHEVFFSYSTAVENRDTAEQAPGYSFGTELVDLIEQRVSVGDHRAKSSFVGELPLQRREPAFGAIVVGFWDEVRSPDAMCEWSLRHRFSPVGSNHTLSALRKDVITG